MPRIGKESHVAQFLKLAHTGLKFDRYEQPQNVVVKLNNKKNPLPLMYFICISFLRFSSSRRETFLSKIERNIVERKMRKERIEIIFAKESQESELSVTKIHPPFDGTSWILFNKDVSSFYIRTSFVLIPTFHGFFPLGGNLQGLEIHHDGGGVAAHFTVSLVGRRD